MLLENMMDEIAIHGQDAYKVFHKQSSFSWQRRNGREASRQVVAVDNVSFDVGKGEIFGVLGPNGSGKSTLVRLIATLLLPDGGSITVFDHSIMGIRETELDRWSNRYPRRSLAFRIS